MIGLHREYVRTWSSKRIAGILATYVLPHAAFYLWTIRTWGNLGGPQLLGAMPFTIAGSLRGVTGLLLDRQSGLVSYAPIYLLLVAWWFLASSRTRWLILPVLSLLLPMSAFEVWWAGFAPAARYLVPVVPFCAVAAAESLQFAVLRRTFAALLVVELPAILYAWQHPRVLWPDGEGNPLLARLGPIGRAYETFLPPVHYGDLGTARLPAIVVLIANVALIVVARRAAGRRSAVSQI
jgi:hypothetical protein